MPSSSGCDNVRLPEEGSTPPHRNYMVNFFDIEAFSQQGGKFVILDIAVISSDHPSQRPKSLPHSNGVDEVAAKLVIVEDSMEIRTPNGALCSDNHWKV